MDLDFWNFITESDPFARVTKMLLMAMDPTTQPRNPQLDSCLSRVFRDPKELQTKEEIERHQLRLYIVAIHLALEKSLPFVYRDCNAFWYNMDKFYEKFYDSILSLAEEHVKEKYKCNSKDFDRVYRIVNQGIFEKRERFHESFICEVKDELYDEIRKEMSDALYVALVLPSMAKSNLLYDTEPIPVLAMLFRYVTSAGEIHERYWGQNGLDDDPSGTIISLVDYAIEEFGLKDKLVALCVDGFSMKYTHLDQLAQTLVEQHPKVCLSETSSLHRFLLGQMRQFGPSSVKLADYLTELNSLCVFIHKHHEHFASNPLAALLYPNGTQNLIKMDLIQICSFIMEHRIELYQFFSNLDKTLEERIFDQKNIPKELELVDVGQDCGAFSKLLSQFSHILVTPFILNALRSLETFHKKIGENYRDWPGCVTLVTEFTQALTQWNESNFDQLYHDALDIYTRIKDEQPNEFKLEYLQSEKSKKEKLKLVKALTAIIKNAVQFAFAKQDRLRFCLLLSRDHRVDGAVSYELLQQLKQLFPEFDLDQLKTELLELYQENMFGHSEPEQLLGYLVSTQQTVRFPQTTRLTSLVMTIPNPFLVCQPQVSSYYNAVRMHMNSAYEPNVRWNSEATLCCEKEWCSQLVLDHDFQERVIERFYEDHCRFAKRKAEIAANKDETI